MAKTFQEWVAEVQAANPNDWLGGEWLDGAGGGWEAGYAAAVDAAAEESDRAFADLKINERSIVACAVRDRIAKLKDAPAAG